MISPNKVRVFYLTQNEIASVCSNLGCTFNELPPNLYLNLYGNDNKFKGTSYNNVLSTIIEGNIPWNIRRAATHNIPYAETSIIDPIEVFDFKSIPNDQLFQLRAEELVTSIRYNISKSKVDNKLVSYAIFEDGHIELVLLLNQCSNQSTDQDYIETKNPVLLVVEDKDGNAIVSTKKLSGITDNSLMLSNGQKVIRIILQLGTKELETDAKVRPYNIFNSIDFGILELSTEFNDKLNTIENSEELINFFNRFNPTPNKGIIRSLGYTTLTKSTL